MVETKTAKVLQGLACQTLNEYMTEDMDVLDIGAHDDTMAKATKWRTYTMVDLKFDRLMRDDILCFEMDAWELIKGVNMKYDFIILSLFIEHLEAGKFDTFLYRLKKILKDDGMIYIRYPNADSINRRIGVEMGLLKWTEGLSEADIKAGHKSMFRYETIEWILHNTLYQEFEVVDEGGYMFKPLPLDMMDTYFGDCLQRFVRLGNKLPITTCGEIWIILKKHK